MGSIGVRDIFYFFLELWSYYAAMEYNYEQFVREQSEGLQIYGHTRKEFFRSKKRAHINGFLKSS